MSQFTVKNVPAVRSRVFGQASQIANLLGQGGEINGDTAALRADVDQAFAMLDGAADTQPNELYVSKAGSDNNDGLALTSPLLTFTAAIAAAVRQAPSAASPYVIHCEDAGIYVESIVLAQYVSISAPAATLQGQVTLADDSCVRFHEVTNNAGFCFLKPAGQTGASGVETRITRATGAAFGCVNLALGGLLFYHNYCSFVETGWAMGSATGATGHTHFDIDMIHITGAGGGVAKTGAGNFVGQASHIGEMGAGVGAGTGIWTIGGEIDIEVDRLETNLAYQVEVGATLRLMLGAITGATVINGTAYVSHVGYQAGAPANWAVAPPTDTNTAYDRLAAAVAGLLGVPIP